MFNWVGDKPCLLFQIRYLFINVLLKHEFLYFTRIWIYVLEAPLVPYYTLGCCVFGLSGFCQLLAEPAHLYLQRKLVIRAPVS